MRCGQLVVIFQPCFACWVVNMQVEYSFSPPFLSSSERYMVTDHAHRSLVQVLPTGFGAGAEDPGPKLEHSFCLLLLENHRGLACEHLLKAPSE